jgi:amidase
MKSSGLLIGAILLSCGVSFVARAQSFEVTEASIADEQKAMSEGRVTSKALVEAYLKRIEAYDHQGPKLNSILTINPNAVREAEALDRERTQKGSRGPLHGIPVIVKDNYSTTDMPTTAGTIALLGFVPSIDAFQVKKLRDAGAVIVAKSNLHELATGITTVSSAGGQTLNPYDPTRNPGGSSGGTGAAIAAGFAAAGMGTDTCGSIRNPSSQNNLVGLRPSKGLSSIAGIVPLSTTQDVGGPLARSVSDLAAILDATIGEDPADKATHLKAGQTRPNFAQALRPGALTGARLGTLEQFFPGQGDDQEVTRVARAAVTEMEKAGAVIVKVSLPELNADSQGLSLIGMEFKEDLADYLAHSGNPPVHSLDEIFNRGLFNIALEQGLRRNVESKGRASDEYPKVMEKRAALAEVILKAMNEQQLDALVYPTLKRRPAKIGDPQGGSNCQLSPSTGFPALSVQGGFTNDGLPIGIELFGRPFDDAKMVALAYSYEQATHHRKTPFLTPALGSRTRIPAMTWKANGASAGSAGKVAATFTFDQTTGELKYQLAATGFPADDIRAATIHRVTANQTGPEIALLANHDFRNLTGSDTLSGVDGEKLMSGGLYLLVLTKSSGSNVRIALTPAAQH